MLSKWAQISLLFLYVLQLETAGATILDFVGTEREGLWYPLIVFGAMAVGSAISLVTDRSAQILAGAFHWLALPLVTFLVTLRFFPELRVVVAFLPFVAMGAILTCMYAELALWDLVRGFFIAGALFYAGLALIPSTMAKFQLPAIFLTLVFLGLIAAKKSQERTVVVIVSTCLAILLATGYFDLPSLLQQVQPAFADAYQVAPTKFTGVFRTDLLYLPQKKALLLQANGKRFAVLPSRARVARALAGNQPFVLSHDAPYVVTQPRRVLIIGAAEGANVVAALAHGVQEIWAVDINPDVFSFSLNEARDYTGGFYDRPEVHRVASEGRHFLETTTEKFDLITLQGVQTGSRTSMESSALIESYLFTEEALRRLWERLSDRGVIYFEEYRDAQGRKVAQAPTVLATLGRIATEVLPLAAPAEQVRLVSFNQAASNPASVGTVRRRREALFIGKTPISTATMDELIHKADADCALESIAAEDAAVMTDNRPYFVVAALAGRQTALLLVTALALLAAFIALTFRRQPLRQSQQLLLIGMLYMIFVMAVSGPAALILGHPAYVAPVVYGALLGGSLVGGYVVLKRQVKRHFLESVLLVAFLLAVGWGLLPLKSALIAVDSASLRFATVGGLAFLFGLLVELPYLRILAEVDGRQRAVRYFLECAGTVAGVPLGLLIQTRYGVREALLVAAALAFLLSFAIHRAGRVERGRA
jgi:spermidine synthase